MRQPKLLLENFLVGVEGVGLPLVKRISSVEVGLNYVNGQDRKNKYNSHDDSKDKEGSLTVRGLVFAIEGIRAACDRAGETFVRAFLKKNGNNNKECRNKKYNKKNAFENLKFHILKPFDNLDANCDII